MSKHKLPLTVPGAEAAGEQNTAAGPLGRMYFNGIVPSKRFFSRSLLFYWAIYFASILYWECFFGVMTAGVVSRLQLWFVLFALPQSLFLALLSGWAGDRFNRVLTFLLVLLLFAFYATQFVYYRAFGSVISMSMIGMGGDVMEDFGWATMVTIRESVGLLTLLALPPLIVLIWCFLKKPVGGKVELAVRPFSLAAVLVLWLLAGPALRLGGTRESSAYHAYVSALVDADTSAQRIGVLTTTIMDLRSSVAGEEYANEIASTVGAASAQPPISIPDAAVKVPVEASNAAFEMPEVPEITEPSVNILEAIDFSYLASVADQDAIKSLCDYYATVPATNRNAYTGLLEGYNLIYICAESFCGYAINEEVTPTLYKMANEGIVLTNFYNSFKNTTTNGEFAFMTGLWPDVSRKADKGETTGSFSQSADHFMPYGLGNVFQNLGVKSYAFHNYLGRYYGRSVTHPNLGYMCKFMGDMEFTNKWPSSDLEMMEQSIDDYIKDDRFNVYYMTFSGHGPYRTDNNAISRKNAPQVPASLNGRKLESVARCYLANNLEVEYSMEYLLQRLDLAGKLDKTLIVLVGDHYPYYLHDRAVTSLLGELPEKEFERYRSSCILWFAGDEPIVCDTPCCNVDILPTVLNLLGIEYDSRMLSGTDIFSDSLHAAMLYNKNFITDTVKYNAADGTYTWLADPDASTEEEKQAYVESVYSVLKARYAAALAVNKLDFYRFVWENSGLLPSGETASAVSEP